MPLIEIADFNRDSKLDLIFVTEEGEITILYNMLDAEGPKSDDLCNKITSTDDVKSKQVFEKYPFGASDNILKGNINSWSDTVEYKGIHPSLDRASPPGVPGRVRVLDLDLDSFPDLILTLDFYDKVAKETSSRTVII